MILYIDNREPEQIIKYITALNNASSKKVTIEIKSLDIGDYAIYDDKTNKPILLIERKSLKDLDSSIKDGRYNEQSFRLSNSDIPNHNIYYLIEGNIVNYRNERMKNTLYSAMFSLSFYKGFSVYNSTNCIETAEIIYGFASKILKEDGKTGYHSMPIVDQDVDMENTTNTNYCDVIKTSKKANITPDNIMEIMLMQIPGVSHQTSKIIVSKYGSFKELIIGLENDAECLSDLKLETSNRKISCAAITNIRNYLLKI